MCPADKEQDRAAARAAAQQDMDARRKEFLLAPPRWAGRMVASTLADQRDLPVAYLFLNVLALVVPAAVAVYMLPPLHVLGAAYFAATYTLFITRFLVALLHVSEHRRLFKPGYGWLNAVAVHFLAPLFGVPSGLYTLHHAMMHHAEGNRTALDISSTEPYQRDNPLHFLAYWLRHALGAWVELLAYAVRRRQYIACARCLLAEALLLGVVRMLWRWRPAATLWVFLIPYIVTSLALMFGNWSQHIFINPDCPRSAYGMAYNCLACPDNAITCNDGYHIEHHLNPKTHWTQLPSCYINNWEEHAKQQALAFRGIGVFEVGVAVFLGRFEFLVDHLVPAGVLAAKGRGELMDTLRRRLHPLRV